MPGETISRTAVQDTHQELQESHKQVLGKVETLMDQLKDKSHRELLVKTYHEKLRDHITQLQTLSYSSSTSLQNLGVEAMKRLIKLIQNEHQRFERVNPQRANESAADITSQARSFNQDLDAKMRNFSPLVAEEKRRDELLSAFGNKGKTTIEAMGNQLRFLGGVHKGWTSGEISISLKNDPAQKRYAIEHVSGVRYQITLEKNITASFELKDDLTATLSALDQQLQDIWPILQEAKKQQEQGTQIEKTVEAFRGLTKNSAAMQKMLNRPENKRIKSIRFYGNNNFKLYLKDDPSQKPYSLCLTEQNTLKIDGKAVSCAVATSIEGTFNNLISAFERAWEKEFKPTLDNVREMENRRVRGAVAKDLAGFDQTKAEFEAKKISLEAELGKAQEEVVAMSQKVKEAEKTHQEYQHVKNVQWWTRKAAYGIPGFGQVLASLDAATAGAKLLGVFQEEGPSSEDKTMMQALEEFDQANKKVATILEHMQKLKPDFEKAMEAKAKAYLDHLDHAPTPQRMADLQKALQLWGREQEKETRVLFLRMVDRLTAQEKLQESPQEEIKKTLFVIRDYFLAMPRGEEKMSLLAKLFEALQADESLTTFSALVEKVSKNDETMSAFIQELNTLSAKTLLPSSDASTRPFDLEIFEKQLAAKVEKSREANPSPLFRLQMIWDLIEGTEHAEDPRVKEFHEKVKNLLQSGKVNNLYAAYLYDEFDPNAKVWLDAFRHGKASIAAKAGGLGSAGFDYETLLGRKTDRYGRGEKLQEGITRSSLILAKAKIFRGRGTPEDLDQARKLLVDLAQDLIQEAKKQHPDVIKDFHEEKIKKEAFEKARLSAYQELGSEKSRQSIMLKIAKENLPESEQYLSDPDKIEACRKQLKAEGKDFDAIVEQSILASSNAIAEKSAATTLNQKLLDLILKGTSFEIKEVENRALTEKHKTQLEAIAILKDSYGIDGGVFNPSDETAAWIKYIGEEVVVNAALMAISAGVANVARASVQAGARAMLNAGARATFKEALKAGGKATARWMAEEAGLMLVEGAVFHETNAILHGVVKEGSLRTWAQQSLAEHGVGWLESTVALGAIKAASGIHAKTLGEWLNTKSAKLMEQGASRQAAMVNALNYATGVVAEVTGMQFSTVLTTFNPNVLEDPKAWEEALTMVLALRVGGKFPHTEALHKLSHDVTAPLQKRGQRADILKERLERKRDAPEDNSQKIDIGGQIFQHGDHVLYELEPGKTIEGELMIPIGGEKVYLRVMTNGEARIIEVRETEIKNIKKTGFEDVDAFIDEHRGNPYEAAPGSDFYRDGALRAHGLIDQPAQVRERYEHLPADEIMTRIENLLRQYQAKRAEAKNLYAKQESSAELDRVDGEAIALKAQADALKGELIARYHELSKQWRDRPEDISKEATEKLSDDLAALVKTLEKVNQQIKDAEKAPEPPKPEPPPVEKPKEPPRAETRPKTPERPYEHLPADEIMTRIENLLRQYQAKRAEARALYTRGETGPELDRADGEAIALKAQADALKGELIARYHELSKQWRDRPKDISKEAAKKLSDDLAALAKILEKVNQLAEDVSTSEKKKGGVNAQIRELTAKIDELMADKKGEKALKLIEKWENFDVQFEEIIMREEKKRGQKIPDNIKAKMRTDLLKLRDQEMRAFKKNFGKEADAILREARELELQRQDLLFEYFKRINPDIEVVDREKGIFKLKGTEIYGSLFSILDTNGKIDGLRSIAESVQAKKKPAELESRIVMSGSVAQREANPYPTDVDMAEHLRFTGATTRTELGKALAESVRETVGRSKNNPRLEFIEMKLGLYPEGVEPEMKEKPHVGIVNRTAKGEIIKWSFQEIEQGYKVVRLAADANAEALRRQGYDVAPDGKSMKVSLERAAQDPGLHKIDWRGFDHEGRLTEITKVVYVEAPNVVGFKGTTSVSAPLREVHLIDPSSLPDMMAEGTNPVTSSRTKNFLIGSAIGFALGEANYLKGCKKLYSTSKLYGEIELGVELQKILSSPYGELHQLQEQIGMIGEALRSGTLLSHRELVKNLRDAQSRLQDLNIPEDAPFIQAKDGILSRLKSALEKLEALQKRSADELLQEKNIAEELLEGVKKPLNRMAKEGARKLFDQNPVIMKFLLKRAPGEFFQRCDARMLQHLYESAEYRPYFLQMIKQFPESFKNLLGHPDLPKDFVNKVLQDPGIPESTKEKVKDIVASYQDSPFLFELKDGQPKRIFVASSVRMTSEIADLQRQLSAAIPGITLNGEGILHVTLGHFGVPHEMIAEIEAASGKKVDQKLFAQQLQILLQKSVNLMAAQKTKMVKISQFGKHVVVEIERTPELEKVRQANYDHVTAMLKELGMAPEIIPEIISNTKCFRRMTPEGFRPHVAIGEFKDVAAEEAPQISSEILGSLQFPPDAAIHAEVSHVAGVLPKDEYAQKHFSH